MSDQVEVDITDVLNSHWSGGDQSPDTAPCDSEWYEASAADVFETDPAWMRVRRQRLRERYTVIDTPRTDPHRGEDRACPECLERRVHQRVDHIAARPRLHPERFWCSICLSNFDTPLIVERDTRDPADGAPTRRERDLVESIDGSGGGD